MNSQESFGAKITEIQGPGGETDAARDIQAAPKTKSGIYYIENLSIYQIQMPNVDSKARDSATKHHHGKQLPGLYKPNKI